MAQFDVHRNKGPLKESIPFVVVVQSALFDRYRRRMVVPLVRRSALPGLTAAAGSRMNPVFEVEGVPVVLHPMDMVSVAFDQLGEHITSLAEYGQAIADALDELLTRSWGYNNHHNPASSGINIPSAQGIGFNELTTGLYLVAHQHGKDAVSLDGVVNLHF